MAVAFEELDHEFFMGEALKEGEAALGRGDRPIGAVVVKEGEIIASGSSRQFSERRRIAHAELTALLACDERIYDESSRDCVVYTTVEPCPMCLGAIVMSNIGNVAFGAYDRRAGAGHIARASGFVREHLANYIGGVRAEECLALMRRGLEANNLTTTPEEAEG